MLNVMIAHYCCVWLFTMYLTWRSMAH